MCLVGPTAVATTAEVLFLGWWYCRRKFGVPINIGVVLVSFPDCLQSTDSEMVGWR
jgi:hypothetical protein